MSFYNQWRENRGFECTISKQGEFQKRLFAGVVDAFDFTQDCNAHSEYTRCFYRLMGNNLIYQETPCDEPRIKWKTVEGELIRQYKSEQAAIWTYIRERYIETESAYQVSYERKPEQKVEENSETASLHTPVADEQCLIGSSVAVQTVPVTLNGTRSIVPVSALVTGPTAATKQEKGSSPTLAGPTLEGPMITIPLWVFNHAVTGLKYGADNAGNWVVCTELSRCLKVLEEFSL
jgi:hypothetical protein